MDRSILTPHVYPPSITHATFLGTTLWEQCRVSFGYLQTKGFCPTKSTPLVDLSAAAFGEPVSASAILPNVTVITDAVVSSIPNVSVITDAVVDLINNSSGVVPNATVIADAVVHIIVDAVARLLPSVSLFPNITAITSTLQPPPAAILDAVFRRRLQQDADGAPAAAAAGSDGDAAVVPTAADANVDTDGDGLEMDWEAMDGQIAPASADSADARPRPGSTPRQACKVFPVLIGETGSAMTSSVDWQWLTDFAMFINSEVRLGGAGGLNRGDTVYMGVAWTASRSGALSLLWRRPGPAHLRPWPGQVANQLALAHSRNALCCSRAQGAAAAYNPVPVNGWLWWAYNENSGDTGGIVKNYWQDLHWDKINFMIARMGLRPWYLRTSRRT